jgi:signal transduction histidine kinase
MKKTTMAYVVALSLIALLAIATHVIVDAVVRSMESSAEVVNVSGRQRMLSQRIAGLSERLVNLPEGPEAEMVTASLVQAIDLMASSHEGLVARATDRTTGASRASEPIYQIYQSDPHTLRRRVQEYLAAARGLIALPAHGRASSDQLRYIRLEAGQPLLASLDAAVSAYQARSEMKVTGLRRLLFVMLAVLLLALVVVSVTVFRPLIRRLEDATERATAANAQKTAFLANMSHEIRTPLGGMIGLTDLILESPGSPKAADYAKRLKEAGRHLLSVVNDILHFTKISSGMLRLEPEPFRLANLADAVEATFGPSAEQKGVRLILDCPTDRRIVADEFRLRQVVFNLVGNALKATAAGEVALRLQVSGDPDDRGTPATLSVTVTDTGTGMAQEMLDKVFEPYVQAGPSKGGTGLGLVICRDLVRTMGGDIAIASAPGVGSEFTFSIPTEAAGRVEATVAASAEIARPRVPAGLRILVADDDALNRMLMDAAMSKLGYSVTTVPDGRQALDAARADAFDAIILDIQMPEMDGLEAQQAIRAENLDRGRPVIALTADVVPENVSRYLAAGFDACLSKPFDWDAIDLAIRGEA